MKKIVILGEGAWGTALATVLEDKGYDVLVWCYHAAIAEEIMQKHTNTRYMPDVKLSPLICATNDCAQIFSDTAFICEAMPVQYIRSVIAVLKPFSDPSIPWIITSKGIEKDSLLLPSQIVEDVLGHAVQYGVLSGPSFARELIQKKVTEFVVASQDITIQNAIKDIFDNDHYINTQTSFDTIGLQICGAFKNVVAFVVGIYDGAGNGDNTRAIVATICFNKMIELVLAAGGSIDTVHGIGGFGDLFLTASSTQSRNYQIGKLVGSGVSLQHALEQTGFTPEGINTVASIVAYAKQFGVDLDLSITDYIGG